MAESDSKYELISRKEALARGLKHYFTGKPCKRGHISLRLASVAGCCECHAFVSARWRNKNPGKAKKASADYHAKNKEFCNALCRNYYADNKERERERKKRWFAANRDHMNKKSKDWRSRNPETVNVYTRTRRARIRGNGGRHTAKDVAEIFASQRGRCAYCHDKLGKNKQVDHIIPLARGGTNDRRNLQILCGECNLSKHDSDPIDHAQTLGLLL